MDKKEKVSTGGCGISTILLVVFIVLKLTGLIDWSWWWVLAPLWIPVILLLIFSVVVFTIIVIQGK